MGNATLWWYPTDANDVESIDLGEGLSDLQVEPVMVGPQSRSVAGRNRTTTWSAFHQVRLVLERFTAVATVRALLSLEAHLKRGGLVEIAADSAKAWGAFVSSPHLRGDTVLATSGSPFASTTGAVVATDEIWVRTFAPEFSRELNTVSSITNDEITLSAGLIEDHKQSPIFVHHRDFWPAMQLARSARGRPLLTHDHRLNYTLDLLLEESPETLLAYAGQAGTQQSAGNIAVPPKVFTAQFFRNP